MRISVKTLSASLLVAGGLLVAMIVAFVGVAHLRAHRQLKDLPGRLGANIEREADGYTYSQTVGGRTVFTIHAAKAVQHKDGNTTLHDVGITLYGQGGQQGAAQRNDRIYGNEFEYDEKADTVRADGEVHIDLQAPQSSGEAGADHGDNDHAVVHVTTSGLIFLRKLGVAATEKPLDFVYRGLRGHATGAEYDTDTGRLVLSSQVHVEGLQAGQPLWMTASHAEMSRVTDDLKLTHVQGELGRDQARRRLETEQAEVRLRRDGTVESVQAVGGVKITQPDGAVVTAAAGEVAVSEDNQPRRAMLRGNVMLVQETPERTLHGESDTATVAFDPNGTAQQVVLEGNGHLAERVAMPGPPSRGWSERDLRARRVVLGLATDAERHTHLHTARAEGDALLTATQPPPATNRAGQGRAMIQTLRGDVVTASFVAGAGQDHLHTLQATGNTAVQQQAATGVIQTSTGDSLDALFRVAAVHREPGPHAVSGRASAATPEAVGDELVSATQQGHVEVTRHDPAAAAGQADQHATAMSAQYDGSTQAVTLRGDVLLREGGDMLWADRMVMHRSSGDAEAEGTVKASYVADNAAGGSVHVLAARARMTHATGVMQFEAAPHTLARLWQGGMEVEAPVLVMDQRQRHMVARGQAEDGPRPVHAVFVSAGEAHGGAAAPGGMARRGTLRVSSRMLVYSDQGAEASFTGGAVLESADGRMTADRVDIYLHQTASPGAQAHAPTVTPGSGVERAVALGGVVLEQPGRRGTGSRLEYTAPDGSFVLTGTQGAPPRVVDAVQGSITGSVIRFHAGDNEVTVSGGQAAADGQRVRTEIQVKP